MKILSKTPVGRIFFKPTLKVIIGNVTKEAEVGKKKFCTGGLNYTGFNFSDLISMLLIERTNFNLLTFIP